MSKAEIEQRGQLQKIINGDIPEMDVSISYKTKGAQGMKRNKNNPPFDSWIIPFYISGVITGLLIFKYLVVPLILSL